MLCSQSRNQYAVAFILSEVMAESYSICAVINTTVVPQCWADLCERQICLGVSLGFQLKGLSGERQERLFCCAVSLLRGAMLAEAC